LEHSLWTESTLEQLEVLNWICLPRAPQVSLPFPCQALRARSVAARGSAACVRWAVSPSRTLSQARPRMKPELSPAAIVFFSPHRRAELHPPYFSSRRGNTSELPLQPLFLPEFWPPPSLTFSPNLSCRWMHPRRSERRRTAAASASAAVARCASVASAAQ
jgi:hypothetical protein